jgi:Nitroreductase family
LPGNQAWARQASVQVILISRRMMRLPGAEADVPSPTHSFDTGAASRYFALQASKMGWHAHGMSGLDRERAIAELGIPEGYMVEAAYAVGRICGPSTLPPALQAREHPNSPPAAR